MKKSSCLGGGGFIGGHLITKLKSLGRGVDIKFHEFKQSDADEFIIADLRDPIKVDVVIDETIDEVYQLAADMGGSTIDRLPGSVIPPVVNFVAISDRFLIASTSALYI